VTDFVINTHRVVILLSPLTKSTMHEVRMWLGWGEGEYMHNFCRKNLLGNVHLEYGEWNCKTPPN
jgi:hypothetical protein